MSHWGAVLVLLTLLSFFAGFAAALIIGECLHERDGDSQRWFVGRFRR